MYPLHYFIYVIILLMYLGKNVYWYGDSSDIIFVLLMLFTNYITCRRFHKVVFYVKHKWLPRILSTYALLSATYISSISWYTLNSAADVLQYVCYMALLCTTLVHYNRILLIHADNLKGLPVTTAAQIKLL